MYRRIAPAMQLQWTVLPAGGQYPLAKNRRTLGQKTRRLRPKRVAKLAEPYMIRLQEAKNNNNKKKKMQLPKNENLYFGVLLYWPIIDYLKWFSPELIMWQ